MAHTRIKGKLEGEKNKEGCEFEHTQRKEKLKVQKNRERCEFVTQRWIQEKRALTTLPYNSSTLQFFYKKKLLEKYMGKY